MPTGTTGGWRRSTMRTRTRCRRRGFRTTRRHAAMAPAWRTTKSVYGPVFTGASAGLAARADAGEVAAFEFRLAAAAGMLALVAVAPWPRRYPPSRRLRRLEPAAGDRLRGRRPQRRLDDGARARRAGPCRPSSARLRLRLGARRRREVGRPGSAAAEPLALEHREARASAVGFLVAAAAIATAAFLAFGTSWLTTIAPVAQRHAAWALPSRLGALGLPGWLALLPLAIAVPWLVRSAKAGRGRLALTSSLLLVGTPWLLPWYAVWAVPLAAVEEDALAWVLTLALCAYLLPDRVPI